MTTRERDHEEDARVAREVIHAWLETTRLNGNPPAVEEAARIRADWEHTGTLTRAQGEAAQEFAHQAVRQANHWLDGTPDRIDDYQRAIARSSALASWLHRAGTR